MPSPPDHKQNFNPRKAFEKVQVVVVMLFTINIIITNKICAVHFETSGSFHQKSGFLQLNEHSNK